MTGKALTRKADKTAQRSNKQKHEFGGFWTDVKLERVATYLPFFTREMENDFRTIYFDAFAGSGTVDPPKPKQT